MTRFVLLVVCVSILLAAGARAGDNPYPQRWIYISANLANDAGLQAFIELLKQAKASGCTHALLTEGRWLKFPDDAAYQARADKASATAKDLAITLVPSVCAIGYSGRYFHFDPNLAAGVPVKEMRFIVNGKLAQPDPALAPDLLKLTRKGNVIEGKLPLKSFHHYKLTFRLIGRYEGDAEELVRVASPDGKRWISRSVPAIDRKKDDQLLVTTFNTLESTEVRFRINPDKARAEELSLQPAGTLLLVRRALVPLTVSSEDGKTLYEEGKDFKPLHDADMLKSPFDGEFTVDRTASPLVLTDGSRIKDGQTLKLSFWHTLRIGSDQDSISLEDPKTLEVLEIDIRNCTKVWKPSAYFLGYDEIRLAGWEPLPDGKQLKPGELLAQHFRKSCELARKYNPNATLYTWSDMFTPHHNARPMSGKGYYYLVNGTWDGAWEGLSKDVIIMNWYAPKAEGMRFFAERGHAQVICGFYDAKKTEQMKRNIDNWLKVSEGVPNVLGFMYTTWQRNYAQLPEYFQLLEGQQTHK